MLDQRLVEFVSERELCLSPVQRRRPGRGEEALAQCHGKGPPELQTFVPGSALPGLGIPKGNAVLITWSALWK